MGIWIWTDVNRYINVHQTALNAETGLRLLYLVMLLTQEIHGWEIPIWTSCGVKGGKQILSSHIAAKKDFTKFLDYTGVSSSYLFGRRHGSWHLCTRIKWILGTPTLGSNRVTPHCFSHGIEPLLPFGTLGWGGGGSRVIINACWFVVKLSYDGVLVIVPSVSIRFNCNFASLWILFVFEMKKRCLWRWSLDIYFCILRMVVVWEYDVKDQGVC